MRLRQNISVGVLVSLLLTSANNLFAQTIPPAPPQRLRSVPPSLAGVHGSMLSEAVRLASTDSEPPVSHPERSWAGRHPVLLGALLGFGGGVAFTSITAAAGTGCAHSSDYTCGQFVLWFGGLGAGIGAGAGGIVALVRR